MTTDRLRFSLAAAALAATVSFAGVASAHEGKAKDGSGTSKPCKTSPKVKGKGYEVQGRFAWADLEQVAGASTTRTNDDRYSGTVVVDVLKGNKRGRRDVGLSSYSVTGVRVIGAAADGTLPAEGTRVQLVGKQLVGKQARNCAPGPTTPEPTTPTEPEPTATQFGRPVYDDPALPAGEEVDEDIATDESADDDRTIDDDPKPADEDEAKPEDERKSEDDAKADDDADAKKDDSPKRRPKVVDDAPADEEDTAADEETVEPAAVTDVAIRVVHFKVRPAAARR